MALNIRKSETEYLVKELVALTGETKTEAVTRAVEERLDRLRREGRGRRLADELDRIALHCSDLPVLDAREADEIIGYDEYGVPGQ